MSKPKTKPADEPIDDVGDDLPGAAAPAIADPPAADPDASAAAGETIAGAVETLAAESFGEGDQLAGALPADGTETNLPEAVTAFPLLLLEEATIGNGRRPKGMLLGDFLPGDGLNLDRVAAALSHVNCGPKSETLPSGEIRLATIGEVLADGVIYPPDTTLGTLQLAPDVIIVEAVNALRNVGKLV